LANKKTILLSGYFGFGNCGDELIYEIEKDKFKNAGFNVITLTKKPELNYEFKRNSFFQLLKAVSRSDIVVSGGGGLLQDKTSLNSLIYYLFVLFLGKIFRKKTACFAQGIGPLNTHFGQFLAKFVLNKTNFISVRDDFSENELKKCGMDKEIYKTADVVFLADREEQIQLPYENFIVFAPGRSIQMPDTETLIEIGRYIYEKSSLPVIVVPFYPERDGSICMKVSQKLNTPVVVPSSPFQYPYIISRSTFVVGMRYHSVLLSALKGKSFVGLSYDPKVKALMDEFSVKGIDNYADITLKEFKTVFDFNFSHRADVEKKLLSKINDMKERAMKNFSLFNKTFS
jgi:polysaccharide pyruvyl transferase CsaB